MANLRDRLGKLETVASAGDAARGDVAAARAAFTARVDVLRESAPAGEREVLDGFQAALVEKNDPALFRAFSGFDIVDLYL